MLSIKIEDLSKSFEGKRGAVNHIDLKVIEGEILTLLGPSGCGKTTTLRMIAGLEENDTGTIWIGERVVSSSVKKIFIPPEKREVGMVFQSYAIWPHMTVFENVAYPLKVRKKPKKEINEKVRRVLKLLGLEELESRLASRLSGGQQQRVAIARALVFEPKVLLMDEPLSNLDAKLRERMRFEIRQLQQQLNITTIYVTHDQVESMILSDRIVVMNSGKIEQVGTPRDIYERPMSKFVSEFIGMSNFISGRVERIISEETIGPDSEFKKNYFLVKSQELNDFLICTVEGSDLRVGDNIILSVRPEHISISGVPIRGKHNTFCGEVVVSAYAGNLIEYEINVNDLKLRTVNKPSQEYPVGSKVWIEFDKDSLVALPRKVSVLETGKEQECLVAN